MKREKVYITQRYWKDDARVDLKYVFYTDKEAEKYIIKKNEKLEKLKLKGETMNYFYNYQVVRFK